MLGRKSPAVLDELLLIEPSAAAAYEARTRPVAVDTPVDGSDGAGPIDAHTDPRRSGRDGGDGDGGSGDELDPGAVRAPPRPTRFFATAELDPVRASSQFAQIVQEIVGLFTTTPGTTVRIRVDIEADDERGFGETTVRAARENSTSLGLTPADFE